MHKFVTRGLSVLATAAALALGGCGASLDQLTSAAVEKPIEPASYRVWPSTRYLDKGKFAYRQGDFGLAVDAFSKAVEEEKDNAEAWLGLAAS